MISGPEKLHGCDNPGWSVSSTNDLLAPASLARKEGTAQSNPTLGAGQQSEYETICCCQQHIQY
jgi:hypothetical protein